jgi:hypothetical protein
MKEGEAWTQCRARITLEKSPTTPFDPGGTAAALRSSSA